MDWYGMPARKVLEKLESGMEGISRQEAEDRLKEFGKNTIRERKKKAWWQVFFEQFEDLLVWILIAAAVISAVTNNGESSIVIGAVLLLNAVLGTVEHQKAEKSLESLRALSAPEAVVIREGKKRRIPAEEVVLGDVLVLETGDLAAADGRILEETGLLMDESSLTGESAEVEKSAAALKESQVPLAAQSNMVFSGTLVTGGRGLCVVTAAGMDTELGKIAGLMNETAEKRTPLEISLDRFSGKLAAGILAVCVVVFWMDVYRGAPLIDAVMFSVALAVAAIPEALGSIVTIVQAIGTQKMAREQGIIKDLKAVESLGCVSVICTDKTGTLTQNRMAVEEIFCDFSAKVLGGQAKEALSEGEQWLWKAAVLANNASGESGEPTELALLSGAKGALGEGEDNLAAGEGLRRRYLRKGEQPFDSRRKRMSVCCLDTETGKEAVLAKGEIGRASCRERV